MCDLMGMSFNLAVRPSISFRGFQKKGEHNPDGWGLGFYPDEAAQVFKEPIKARKSQLSEFICDYPKIKSKLFIAHVRLGTKGGIKYKNTHPFHRELNGKEYLFAHNGTLNTERFSHSSDSFDVLGSTDSEKAFCNLLERIKRKNINKWSKDFFNWLSMELKRINEGGMFNCIFTDGEHLFCYQDKNGRNNLSFVHRKAPYHDIKLLDSDFKINLKEEKDHKQTGFVIATEPLTDEQWIPFQPGELTVFKNGKITYSNNESRMKEEYTQPIINKKELDILKTLRKSQHRMKTKKISQSTDIPKREAIKTIKQLLKKDFITQDTRDNVNIDHEDATFYTNPDKREKIDKIINK